MRVTPAGTIQHVGAVDREAVTLCMYSCGCNLECNTPRHDTACRSRRQRGGHLIHVTPAGTIQHVGAVDREAVTLCI